MIITNNHCFGREVNATGYNKAQRIIVKECFNHWFTRMGAATGGRSSRVDRDVSIIILVEGGKQHDDICCRSILYVGVSITVLVEGGMQENLKICRLGDTGK